MPRKPDNEYSGMLVAERLRFHQDEPYVSVNSTSLRLSLEERRGVRLSKTKVSNLVRELSTVSRGNSTKPWFDKKGNSLTISDLDKVIRDHRSCSALLLAGEISKQDKSQTKIVFDITAWMNLLNERHGFQEQLCKKFLTKYRECGYTESLSKAEEEIKRDIINQDKNIILAISKCPELIDIYD